MLKDKRDNFTFEVQGLKSLSLRATIILLNFLGFFILLLFLLASDVRAFGNMAGSSGECKDCHSLKPEEAENILKNGAIPELRTVKVTSISQAPLKGLWEIFIQREGRKGIIYLDFSKKFIMIGQIVELKTSKNITQDRFLELNKVDVSKIPLNDAIVMGDRKAKYKVIVFTDPDCPFCARLHNEMKQVVEKRKDIAFYIKLFPLPNHKDAYWKSKSIQCKKSLELLEENFEGKAPPKPDCETDQIDKNISLGRELGINSTPTIILPDGRIIPGAIPADRIIELISG